MKKGAYGIVYQEIMRSPDLPGNAKLIYAYLASFAGKEDECYPSVETICAELNMSKTTMYKYMNALVDCGVIEKKQTYVGNLISPYSIPDAKLDQLHTSLREVLLFIKHSKDKNRIRDMVTADPHFLSVDQKAGQVIKLLTGSDFEIREEEGAINMCKALDDLKEEGRQEGLTGAIFSLLSELGTIPEAIRVQIQEEKSMEVLNLYLKKAAAAKTLEDFCTAIK